MSWQEEFFLQSQFELFEEGNDLKREQVVNSIKEYKNPDQVIKYILNQGPPSFLPKHYLACLFRFLELYLLSGADISFSSLAQMVDFMCKACFLVGPTGYIERLDKVYQFIFQSKNLCADVKLYVDTFSQRNDCCLILAHIAALNSSVMTQVTTWMLKNHQDQPVWLHAFAVLFRSGNRFGNDFIHISRDLVVNSVLPIACRADLMNAIVTYLRGDDALNFMRENVYPIVTLLSSESSDDDVLCFLELLVSLLQILKQENLPREKLLDLVFDVVLPLVRPSERARDLMLSKFCDMISVHEIKQDKFDHVSDFAQKCIAAVFPTDYNTPFIFKKPIDRTILVYFTEHNEFPFIYLVPLFENSDIHHFVSLFQLRTKKPRSFWNKIVKFLPFCSDFDKLQHISEVLLDNDDIPLVIASEIDSAYINVASQMILNPVRYAGLLPITEYLRNCKANMEAYRMDKPVEETQCAEDTDKPTLKRTPEKRKRSVSAAEDSRESSPERQRKPPPTEEEEKKESPRKPRLVRRRRRRSVAVESTEMETESTESDSSQLPEEPVPSKPERKLVRRRRRIPRPDPPVDQENSAVGDGEKDAHSVDEDSTESDASEKPKRKLIRRRRRRREDSENQNTTNASTEDEEHERTEGETTTNPECNTKKDNLVLIITKQIASVPAWSSELLFVITNRIDGSDEMAAAFLPILATNTDLLRAFCPESDIVQAVFFGNLLSRDKVGAELLGSFLVSSNYSERALPIALKALSKAEYAYPDFDFYENTFIIALSYEDLRSLCCQTIVLTCDLLEKRSIDFSMLVLKLLDVSSSLNVEEFESSLAATIRVTNRVSDIEKVIGVAISRPRLEASLLENWEEARTLFFETLARMHQGHEIYESFVRNRMYLPSLGYLAPVLLRVSKDDIDEISLKIKEMDSETSLRVLRDLISGFDTSKKREEKRFCLFIQQLIERCTSPGEIVPAYVEKFCTVPVSKEIAFIQPLLAIARKDFVYFYCQLGLSKSCHFVKSVLKQICQLVEFKEQCLACLENEFYAPEPNLPFCFLVFRKFVQFQLQDEDHAETATLLVLIALAFGRTESGRSWSSLNHCLLALSSKIGIPLGEVSADFVFEKMCKNFVRHFFLLHNDVIMEFIERLLRHKEVLEKTSLLFAYLSLSLGPESEGGKKAAVLYLEHCETLLSKDELFVTQLESVSLTHALKTKLLGMVIEHGSLRALSLLVNSCPKKLILPRLSAIVRKCCQGIYREASLDILTILCSMEEAKGVLCSNPVLLERLTPLVVDRNERVCGILTVLLGDSNVFERLLILSIEKFRDLQFYQRIVSRSIELAKSLPLTKREHVIRLFDIIKPVLSIETPEFESVKSAFLELIKSLSTNPSLTNMCENIRKSIDNKELLTLKRKENSDKFDRIVTLL